MATAPVLIDTISEFKTFTCVDWIGSEFVAVGSQGAIHLYKLSLIENTYRLTDHIKLTGFRSRLVCVKFARDVNAAKGTLDANPGELYGVDESGQMMHWRYNEETEEWAIVKSKIAGKCTCAAISFEKRLFAIGEHGGYVFFNLETFEKFQSLAFAKNANISSIAFNSTGDWIALAVQSLGQLLIWDWNAQTCK